MTKQTSPTHRPLNQKQKHFLDRYHITGNVGQSWLDAGYNCTIESASSNAGRVLQREDARQYLASLQQHDRLHTGLTREKILARLEAIIDSPDARDRDVIVACREAGRIIGAYQPKPAKPEPQVDTLQEFIRKVRAGEIQESENAKPSPPGPAPASAEIYTSGNSLWLPDSSDEENTSNTEPSPEHEEQAESPTCESPLEQLARTRKARAARAEARRDPDWHPQYNPYYDPTSDQYAKKSTPLVRWR